MHTLNLTIGKIMMVVDSVTEELTSTQVTSVPSRLSIAGEINNLDDTGLPSGEILEIFIVMVELSIA